MRRAALQRAIQPIDAEIGEGAGDSGCRLGGPALRRAGLLDALGAAGRTVRPPLSVASEPARARDRMDCVENFSEQLARVCADAVAEGAQPLVLGGDHSCAVGTWSGVAHALRPHGALGLVWIDAHLDAHTPATSDSQAPHGMPLAALLGHGPRRLTQALDAFAKVAPQHLVLIGARSYEPAEAALLARLGVRVIGMAEVRERGFAACFEEARARATRGTAGWGLSVDVDGLDPCDAPGTGTPVAGGIRLDDAVRAFEACVDDRLVALEIAEYNPLRDYGGHTARGLRRLVHAALGAKQALPLAA